MFRKWNFWFLQRGNTFQSTKLICKSPIDMYERITCAYYIDKSLDYVCLKENQASLM